MRKLIFVYAALLAIKAFPITTGSSLNIAPTSLLVNKKMGASLAVWNYTYCAGCSIRVVDIIPQTWVTVGGSSTVPVAWAKVALGPGQPTVISPGSSIVYRYSAVFFAPSISPAYDSYTMDGASLLAKGTQTFSVGALVRTSNGEVNSSNSQTVTVSPLPLPTSQRGARGN